MNERPILFSVPMVRAILAGKKSQSRRIVRPQPPALMSETVGLDSARMTDWVGESPDGEAWRARCPFGEQGRSRLWVRETCWIAPPDFGDADLTTHTDPEGRRRCVSYAASMDGESERCARDYGLKPTPSIFMPRWASRLTLELTDVRLEQLQDISDADACAEGAQCFFDLPRGPLDLAHPYQGLHVPSRWSMFDPLDTDHCLGSARHAFGNAWDIINGKRAPWSANPYVWALTFKRLEKEIR